MLINNIIGILGAASMGFAQFAESYELLIMGRFLIGINCGKQNFTNMLLLVVYYIMD